MSVMKSKNQIVKLNIKQKLERVISRRLIWTVKSAEQFLWNSQKLLKSEWYKKKAKRKIAKFEYWNQK